ncbi:hypothetical protein NMY22_g14946 [Coprinellus aureogranulatus]|nr:hypothetical protein NMY22_g14946 [Coprinellus aureogranulatus]
MSRHVKRGSKPSKPPRRSHFKGYPGIDRFRGKVKVVDVFPEGGSHTYWLSDPSTDASNAEGFDSAESDKENRPPGSSRWRDRSPFIPYKAPQPSSSSSTTRVEGMSSPHKNLSSPAKVSCQYGGNPASRPSALSPQTSQEI